MTTPTLQLMVDGEGQVQAVFRRDDLGADVELYHTLARAPQGMPFAPSQHFPCEVCRHHGFTLAEFHRQWPQASAAFTRSRG